MQRYFAVGKIGDNLILSDEDLHHLFDVLRLKNGEHFQIVFGSAIYDNIVINSEKRVFQSNISSYLVDNKYKLTLILANPKMGKLEIALQKCTEIGCNEFVIFESKRSVAKLDQNLFMKKISRYNKIVLEAAQQSKQEVVPKVTFINSLSCLKDKSYDAKFIAYENASLDSNKKFEICRKCDTLAFVVGPEGGFDTSEIELLNSYGYQNISLGSSILRCETAPIYIASVISFLKMED